MRIGYRKKIGSFYVTDSVRIGGKRRYSSRQTISKGTINGIVALLLSPFYLIYMIFYLIAALCKILSGQQSKNKPEDVEAANQYKRISDDCSRLIATTKKPDVFFERYDLLLQSLEKLSDLEDKVSFNSPKPSEELKRLSSLREEATDDFIDRYAKEIRKKIYDLSTERGKRNAADSFLNNMNEYRDKMSADNEDHFFWEYNNMFNYIYPQKGR